MENHAIYQNNEQTSLEKKEVEPVEPVLKYTCQNSTYRKDLSSPHFDDKLRVQKKQQGNGQQSRIFFFFVACITIPSSNYRYQPRRDNSIPYMGVL